MEEDELPEERTSSTRKKATKKTATTKGNSAARQRTSTRTDKAPAKAYIGEVERLLEEMANAETVEELDKCHNEILDIMYTNIKPLGVKVMDMDFKDAMSAIEKEYSAGLQQLRS